MPLPSTTCFPSHWDEVVDRGFLLYVEFFLMATEFLFFSEVVHQIFYLFFKTELSFLRFFFRIFAILHKFKVRYTESKYHFSLSFRASVPNWGFGILIRNSVYLHLTIIFPHNSFLKLYCLIGHSEGY